MTTNETLRATDIHRDWKRAVSSASLSVRVFTPYFDRLLPQLLKGAKQRGLSVAVVTDLSPTGGQDYPAQLRAAKRLLELGISLKTLPRLHAKVLQVDRDMVGLGSQNFTTYARSSRETSIIPKARSNEARFLDQLDRWSQLASLVDLAMVEALSDRLTNAFRVLAKQEAALHAQYDEIFSAELRKRQALPIQARLRSAAAGSTVTLAAGPAIGTVKRSENFRTFLVENKSDLTRWREEGIVSVLPRLMQIPIIREDTGQIAFCRLAKTRISYIHWSVKWSNNKQVTIGRETYSVTIDLPKENCTEVNIVAHLRLNDTPIVDAKLRYDGTEFALIDVMQSKGRQPTQRELERVAFAESYFSDPDQRARFFSTFFANFVYKKLGRDSPKSSTYFGTSRYRISVLRYNRTPVLLATPI
jgi:hypothetical protein